MIQPYFNPRRPFHQVTAAAKDAWDNAQNLIDGIEDLVYSNLINGDQKLELFKIVMAIQECACKLDKMQITLDNEYCWKTYHANDDADQKDWHDQSMVERPPL